MLKPVQAVFIPLLLISLFGCATTRTITVRTNPPDAIIRIDGYERGRGSVTDQYTFASPTDLHRVMAYRLGFKDRSAVITRDSPAEINLDLPHETRMITIVVDPAPAVVSVDGKPITDSPVSTVSTEVDVGVDARNNPITHVIRAERKNLAPATMPVSRLDRGAQYVLKMEPLTRDVTISTTPPGAQIFLDDEPIGTSPLKKVAIPFPTDLETNQFIPRTIQAKKPGYTPSTVQIAYNDPSPDYSIALGVNQKNIRITTNPPGATIGINGGTLSSNSAGTALTRLDFPPIDDKGDLKTYTVRVNKKTADDEWEPAEFQIGWDDGRVDYSVKLKEILTRPVEMLSPQMKRTPSGWDIVAQRVQTIGMKQTDEGQDRPAPELVTKLAKKSQMGSIALSPDGTQVLYTILSAAADGSDLRSQMMSVKSDGTGGEQILSDGKSLDIMPSYTPGGDQIVFSSNRDGRRMHVWSMSAFGGGGIRRQTSGDTNDLWPSVDSDPRARLFYQAMVDTRSDPRLYMMPLNNIYPTDLTTSGTQPRIGPKNDSILFGAVNDQTGKRDIYRVSDRGGAPEDLTNTPDDDETDASWSKDGRRIVFSSDRGLDSQGRHNYDIWMIDLAKPDKPIQITVNGSCDDSPVFDPTGTSVFFRSNRGGVWGIWKIPVK